MISGKDFEIVRSIARAKGDYGEIKRLLSTTKWEIDADEKDLGYLRVFIPDKVDEFYRLIIGYRDPDHPPYALLSFFLCPDLEENVPAFNSAFQSVADFTTRHLGAPSITGEHKLSFRTWSYAYQRWSLAEGEFTLIQDEFDIQEGIDVTLWIQPVGTPLEETLHL
jgi:hypothetical protein